MREREREREIKWMSERRERLKEDEREGWVGEPEGMCTIIIRMLGRVCSNIMQIQNRSDRRKQHKITGVR